MASFWTFYAFDRRRWDSIFGGGYPKSEKWVIAAATAQRIENLDLDFDQAKQDEWLDTLEKRAPENIKRIAQRICREGVSYDGLDENDAIELDEIIGGWFSPEGLETQLASRELHRMGLSPRAIAELLGRARPGLMGFLKDLTQTLPQLSAFENGRRFGQTAPSKTKTGSLYLIYDTDQAAAALSECEALLGLPSTWKEMTFRRELEDELINSLRSAIAQRQWFAATYAP